MDCQLCGRENEELEERLDSYSDETTVVERLTQSSHCHNCGTFTRVVCESEDACSA